MAVDSVRICEMIFNLAFYLACRGLGMRGIFYWIRAKDCTFETLRS